MYVNNCKGKSPLKSPSPTSDQFTFSETCF